MGQVIQLKPRSNVPRKVARQRSISIPFDTPVSEQLKGRIDLQCFMGSLSIHVSPGHGSGAVYLTEPEVEQNETALESQGWGLAQFLLNSLPAATLKGLRGRLDIPTFIKNPA